MKDHDETGSEIHGFILFEKHSGDYTIHRMEKSVEQRAVMKEKLPESSVNGENTVAVSDMNEFKRHRGRAFHGIFIATGRTNDCARC